MRGVCYLPRTNSRWQAVCPPPGIHGHTSLCSRALRYACDVASPAWGMSSYGFSTSFS